MMVNVHKLTNYVDGFIRVFSRKGDETSRFPDVIRTMNELCNPGTITFIIDVEVVAVDRKKGTKLLSFQELSLRDRGGKSSVIAVDNIKPDVVVNCAALSIPRACETDPTVAMSINVPSSLIKWLSSFTENNTLLIHLSTDQVYEGTKSFYKEDNETLPVNIYGKSKVAAEEYITANWSNFAILRSSIIFGPQTISPVSKSLPIQWMDSVLAKGEETTFFHDEFRCPIYVKDVVNIIQILADRWISDGQNIQMLLNVGGPDRISRVQMAEVVARVRGYDTSLIKPVSASSIDRGVKSPADISMDISKLIQTLSFTPTSFQDGVKLTIDTIT